MGAIETRRTFRTQKYEGEMMGTTNTGKTTDKIKDRVQKLLNQAADRAGTAEGETFYQKAFDLMAAYGFDERDLRNPTKDDEVIMRTFALGGSYTDMQASLLCQLCSALHCTAFVESARGSRTVSTVTAFGRRRHVDRVDMLFGVLNPQMAAGARNVYGSRASGVATVVARRSFMGGFIGVVTGRLQAAEGSVAAGKDEYALALIDDREKASDAMNAFAETQGIAFTNRASKASVDPASFLRGASAGERSDLGQTRVRARPALPC